MRAETPHAGELLEKGEELGVAGALEAAEALFRQAEAEAPSSTVLRRRRCEALTAMGRRDEAIAECSKAMELHTSANLRALVRSLVDGPTAPTVNQVFQALAITSIENRGSPGGVTPTAMACDIAESIGDGVMLQPCAEILERVVPNDSEARRAMAMLRSQCPPSRFWAGWLAIVVAVGFTVAHALRGWLLRGKIRTAAIAVAVVFAAIPGWARAQSEPAEHGMLSKWPVDDEHPEKAIPTEKERNGDPLQFGYWLQDVALKAERAVKHGDHAAAVRFYLALAEAVPDRSVSFTKLCEEYEALGDRDKAIESCGGAILRDGARVGDYTHFVHLVLGKPGPLTAAETTVLGNVIQHMKDDPQGHGAVSELECEVGVRTSNVPYLRECTAALAAVAPEDPKTTTYQWALAVQEGKFDDAEKLIERARLLGVRQDSVENMKRATAESAKRHWFRQILVMLGIGLLLSSGGAAYRQISQRRRASKDAARPALPGEKTAVPG